MDMTISTWFVSDSKDEATYFPQVGGNSSTPDFQQIYWRCIAGFFVTSKACNPGARHMFFTNTALPRIDDVDFNRLFAELNIEVVTMPITYRLPRSVASSWGNQFYILDVIKYLAARDLGGAQIVLDSDCVWNNDTSRLGKILAAHGCATYTLGLEAYTTGQKINGVTRRDMADSLQRWKPDTHTMPAYGIDYHGGEIFAATQEQINRLAGLIDDLWNSGEAGKGFLEEAHFLSILYAACFYPSNTANPVIKRMWTAFKHTNLSPADLGLDIWHLPAEKKSGFAALFKRIAAGERNFSTQQMAVIMGIPKRSPTKFLCDISRKIREKLAA